METKVESHNANRSRQFFSKSILQHGNTKVKKSFPKPFYNMKTQKCKNFLGTGYNFRSFGTIKANFHYESASMEIVQKLNSLDF